ncbi:MAG TPA: hypothetical protein VHK69_16945 [Chitinophagaceae bacterium]|jgi:hypothetical protein|nr:hypothetical protein [Chitinophagaceae bacterium]
MQKLFLIVVYLVAVNVLYAQAGNETQVTEKLFVHSDKTTYLTGETVWLSLYLTDAATGQPASFSKVTYVELVGPDGRAALQAKCEMAEGRGSGSLLLPSFLPSGAYVLRAYTRWMLTRPQDYFEKEVVVLNPARKPDWAPAEIAQHAQLQFFPEGGDLVAGIASKVGFRITGPDFRGTDGSGGLVDDQGDTVARFQSHRFGMGHFIFQPAPGRTYRAWLSAPGYNKSWHEVPAARPQGFVLKVTGGQGGPVRATLHNPGASGPVYLLLQQNNRLLAAGTGNLVNGTAVVEWPAAQLPDGLVQVTALDGARVPVAERLLFRYPRKSLSARIEIGQPQIGIRGAQEIRLRTADQQDSARAASLSLSVFRLDSIGPFSEENMATHLWLSSGLTGPVEKPGFYFSEAGRGDTLALEHLLLVQGWRRFDAAAGAGKPVLAAVPEYEGHIIAARMTERRTGRPAAGKSAWLSAQGQPWVLNRAAADSNGYLYFPVKELHGATELVLFTDDTDSSLALEYLSPFSEATPRLKPLPLRPEVFSRAALARRAESTGIGQAYTGSPVYTLDHPLDTAAFFGTPDRSYLLDDYTRFRTMDEVLQEYVSEVRGRRHSGKATLSVFNIPYRQYFEGTPLVLVDGVPVFNMNQVMDLDPLKIRKLDVLGRKAYFKNATLPGVISISSYLGDLGGLTLDPRALVVSYEGLQLQRQFVQPDYSTPESRAARRPDFRHTLYWNPDLRTGADGQGRFTVYGSDLPGRYAVVVHGLTGEGHAGSAVGYFEVK